MPKGNGRGLSAPRNGGARPGGTRAAHSLVWRDGLETWQPLAAMASELDVASALLGHAGHAAGSATSPAADVPYAPPTAPLAPNSSLSPGDVVPAGFWRRGAWPAVHRLDGGGLRLLPGAHRRRVVLGIGGSLLLRNQDSTEGMAAMFGSMMALVYLLYPVISAAYYAGFESSGKQATLGKMAVGIKVTDAEGRRLTLGLRRRAGWPYSSTTSRCTSAT